MDGLSSNSMIRTGTSYGLPQFQQCGKLIKTNSQKGLSSDMNGLEKLYRENGKSISPSALRFKMNRSKMKNYVTFSKSFSVNCLKFDFLV